MTANELNRLETKVDSVLGELRHVATSLAELRQWKTDQASMCDRHDRGIDQLGRDVDAERQARTLAVAKVRETVGRRLGAQAALAALVGALIPGLVLLVKLWPSGGTP